jgi:hypothetical protein
MKSHDVTGNHRKTHLIYQPNSWDYIGNHINYIKSVYYLMAVDNEFITLNEAEHIFFFMAIHSSCRVTIFRF